MLSYQRYGASDGNPSQLGILKYVVETLYKTHIDTSRIVTFGRYLGGEVGVEIAKNNP